MNSNMIVKVNHTLDCKGLACPMPIIKTKKAIDSLLAGEVIEVVATDKGSIADMQGWCKNTGHQFVGTVVEADVYKHYIRKASPDEIKGETKYEQTISNEGLQQKIVDQQNVTIIDVREPAEFAFQHIPGARSIPIDELEANLNQIGNESEIYVICRTGNRSDLACQLLSEKGYTSVYNVLPGMFEWTGPLETI